MTTYRDVCCVTTNFAVDNDLKRSVATTLAAQSYSGSALDGPGAKVQFIRYGVKAPRRAVTVTTTVAGGSAYNTSDAIVFRGMVNDTQSELGVYLTLAVGGETISTPLGLDIVTSIDVPAMLRTDGTLAFGVGDAIFEPDMPTRIVAGAAGVFKIRTAAGIDRDLTLVSGEAVDLQVQRVLRANATFPLSLYFAS